MNATLNFVSNISIIHRPMRHELCLWIVSLDIRWASAVVVHTHSPRRCYKQCKWQQYTSQSKQQAITKIERTPPQERRGKEKSLPQFVFPFCRPTFAVGVIERAQREGRKGGAINVTMLPHRDSARFVSYMWGRLRQEIQVTSRGKHLICSQLFLECLSVSLSI